MRRNKTAETRAGVKVYFMFFCSRDWSYNKRDKNVTWLWSSAYLLRVCLHRVELKIEIAKVKNCFWKASFHFFFTKTKGDTEKAHVPLAAKTRKKTGRYED